MIRKTLELLLVVTCLLLPSVGNGQASPDLMSIAWSNDGTLLGLVYRNSDVVIKQVDTMQTIAMANVEGFHNITSIAWKPNNSQIIVSGSAPPTGEIGIPALSSAFILNVPNMETAGILPDVSTAGGAIATWSQDSSQIITSGFDIGVIIWDATTYTHLPDYFPAVTIAQLKWTEDRSMLAIAATAASLVVDGDDYSRVFTSTRPESAPPITVGAVAFSPTKQQLISGDGVGDIRVWDTASGDLINTLVATENPSSIYGGRSTVDVAFNPTETMFYSITHDGTLRTWDSVTLSLLDSVVLPGAPINRAAFSPDGRQLAYSGENGSLEIINTPSVTIACDVSPTDTSSLISAITAANSAPDPVTICLAEDATYTFTSAHSSADGGIALPAISGDITIIGNGATLIRDATSEFRFFRIASGGNLSLSDMTLSNGDTTNHQGGAILNNGGILNVDGLSFVGNVAHTGGAIDSDSGSASISNSSFTGNNASYGGAIDNDAASTMSISGSLFSGNQASINAGAIDNDGELSIISSQFVQNSSNQLGGGVVNAQIGSLSISSSQFSQNSSNNRGGGVYNLGDLTLTSVDFSLNEAIANNGWAGALHNDSSGVVSITGGIYSENQAKYGGAIRNNGQMSLNGASFADNTALFRGGAIYVAGSLTLNETTFTENTADLEGGAIHLISNTTVSVTGGVFADNSVSDRGGALFNAGGTLTVVDSRMEGNSATNQAGALYSSMTAISTVNNSCLSGNSATAVVATSSGQQNFQGNWWGAANGPAGSGSGNGDTINNKVDYANFLTGGCPHN